MRRLKPWLVLLPFVVAVWVIHRDLQSFHYLQVVAALDALPVRAILAAVALTALSFLVLSTYDALGLRYAGHPLAYRRSGFASFVGYAFSQALGFTLLTGAPIRFRLYSAWGLDASEIRDLVAFYSVTFWVGFLALGGTTLLLEPLGLTGLLHLPFGNARYLGVLLLALAAAYLAWAVRRRGGRLRIGSWEIAPPGPRTAIAQVVIGTADWTVAGSVLYVLLPADAGITLPVFLGVFLLAQIGGLISNVPGGLGVFEALMLALMPERVPEGALLASILVYRVVYYILPLVTAVAALGLYEVRNRGEALARLAAPVARGVSIVVPQVLAISTFLAGLILLFSGATPAAAGRLGWIADILPLPVIEASHFLGSVAGGGLLVLAWGIQRRLDAAYVLTVALLGGGIAVTLLKGLDYEEAVILTVMLASLVAARREFYRRASLLAEPFTPAWAAAVAGGIMAAVALGFLAYRHVVYSGELWWRFAVDAQVSRFLRASVGALSAVLAFAVARLLAPARPPDDEASPDDVDRAASLAARAARTYALLALLGDKRFLFGRDAFVMYGVEGRSWVALGDPVGARDETIELAWRFREMADRHAGWSVFYQVSAENLPTYIELGLTLNKLGEEARVPLQSFSLEGRHRKSLRATMRRLGDEGAEVRILPAAEVEDVLPELRRISEDWLAHKNTREMGFSLGFFSEDYLRRTAVALVEVDGRAVAFANLLEGGDLEELSIDLMRFADDAPDSVMEYLFLHLMLWGRDQGYRWFNLGMAPLAGLEARPLAPVWNRLGATMFRHGEHFYNFQGLRFYKDKFDPVWEPRYLASPGGLALPRVLTNVATLINGGFRGMIRR